MTARIKASQPHLLKYTKYKDSGIEWLGDVPAHWELARLWRLSSAISGATPTKDNPVYWDGKIPWVSPKDMKRRRIATSQDRITQRALEETGIKLIQPGAVLVVVRGMILAHSFPVAVTTAPVTINQDMKALRLVDGFDTSYFAWTLDGLARGIIATVVEEAAHGTRVIRMDQWRNVVCPVPPYTEQRAIAAFLDRETAKIDALVAKKERLIELLQEKRTALITRAVTRGLDPNVPMKNSGVEWLGETPAHWELVPLRRLIRGIEQGWSPVAEERPAADDEWGVIKLSAVNKGLFREEEHKALPPNTHPDERYEIRQGDFLLTRSNTPDLVGDVCVVGAVRDRLMLCDLVYRLRLVGTRVHGTFLSYWLLSRTGRHRIEVEARGSSRSMVKVSQEIVRALPVATPSLEEQRAIAAFLNLEMAKIDALIARVQEARNHLKELRTALISAAVTGKIDVREAAPR